MRKLSRGTLTAYLGLIVESINIIQARGSFLSLSLNNNYYAIANIFTPLISVFQQSTAHKRTGLRVNTAAPTHTEDPRRSIERVSDKLLI